MGSGWDTYYDRDPADDYCHIHGGYMAYGMCDKCSKENREKKQALRDKAAVFLEGSGIKLEDIL